MYKLENTNTNILVIGDLMIDHYLWGKCERISPEAPVQIVNIEKESSVLGGAGNVINNLRALGSKVDVISVIGNDEVANELKLLLNKIGVEDKKLIIEKNRKTSKKTRLIASQQQVIRYDKESIEDIIIKLEESSDERFRLKYMVSKETIKNKAEFIINKILPKIDSLDTNNESLFTDIRNEINFILNDFIEEIKSNFYKVIDNKYTLFSDLPYYIENIEDKEQFINKNKDLLKNDFGYTIKDFVSKEE